MSVKRDALIPSNNPDFARQKYSKGRAFINQAINIYMWQQWVNVIVGLWIIVSSYFGFTPEEMATNYTISGIIVAGLALWGALQHQSMERDDRMRRHA